MNRLLLGVVLGIAIGIVDVLMMLPTEIPDKAQALLRAFFSGLRANPGDRADLWGAGGVGREVLGCVTTCLVYPKSGHLNSVGVGYKWPRT